MVNRFGFKDVHLHVLPRHKAIILWKERSPQQLFQSPQEKQQSTKFAQSYNQGPIP